MGAALRDSLTEEQNLTYRASRGTLFHEAIPNQRATLGLLFAGRGTGGNG